MVTNLKEGNHVKCQQYWPSSAAVQYGPFIVTLAEQQMFADYIIRHLHISVSTLSDSMHVSIHIYMYIHVVEGRGEVVGSRSQISSIYT